MDLYGQEPEARLLGAFISRLDHRSVIDVGAERGAFAEEMLRAGCDRVYAIEPEPDNAGFLRRRFQDDARVSVHEYAISDADGQLELHKSVDPSGAPVTFGHTVLERPDTDEIAWRETITVTGRPLASLVDAGEVPGRVGILKVDTEGNDLAVVSGMGVLECDVVMVEHWTELPHALGPCPWTTEEMVSVLRPRGFSHFAFVVHRGEFVILKWDDGSVPSGHMGNLVFLHDRMVERLLPDVVECASTLAGGAVERIEAQQRQIKEDRQAWLEVIERLEETLAESETDRAARLELITQLEETLKNVEADRAARLETVEQLEATLEKVEADRAARLDTIDRLQNALAESETDRAARLELITRLEETLKEVEADRAARLETIDRLQNALAKSEADREARAEVIDRGARAANPIGSDAS